jgi:signal transduction histidine kinase
VQVIPPYYETWWFRALVVIIILLVVIVVIFTINRRRYQKRILQLQMAQKIQTERERISKDLHDHVGAHLTRIVTDLDILELKMDRSSDEEKREQIESTRGFTSNTIQLLRDTIWAINKDYYSVEEFSKKARAFLEQYLENRMEWVLDSNIEIERQLGPNEVLNLLRILQEATQNMLKYAKAGRFEVNVESGQSFKLLISDDGVGMDKPLEKQGHYGMQNMKKRAESIGASFEIKTAPGKGVQIGVELSGKIITAGQPG